MNEKSQNEIRVFFAETNRRKWAYKKVEIRVSSFPATC